MATLVEVDPRSSFSITTTPRYRDKGASTFPEMLHFTLDPYLIMLSVNQYGIMYHFWVLGMTWSGIEPWSPGPLAKTQLVNFFLFRRSIIMLRPWLKSLSRNCFLKPFKTKRSTKAYFAKQPVSPIQVLSTFQ